MLKLFGLRPSELAKSQPQKLDFQVFRAQALGTCQNQSQKLDFEVFWAQAFGTSQNQPQKLDFKAFQAQAVGTTQNQPQKLDVEAFRVQALGTNDRQGENGRWAPLNDPKRTQFASSSNSARRMGKSALDFGHHRGNNLLTLTKQ
jgi:hypothetical protein